MSKRKQKRALDFADDTPLAHKSPKFEGKGKEQVIVDIPNEDSDEYTPRDEPESI